MYYRVNLLALYPIFSEQNFPLDKGNSQRQAMWRMGAGALAGSFATILTHPMDVIRANLTVQSPANSVYRG